MKHPLTKEVFAYWDRCRGTRLMPDRADIEPAEIRRALGDTFILALDSDIGHPFRLAGTRICDFFGQELKGRSFIGLWDPVSTAEIMKLLTCIIEERIGIVAGVTGRTEYGSETKFELLLLPLGRHDRLPNRALGLLVPIGNPYWLGMQPVVALTLDELRYIGPQVDGTASPRFSAVPMDRDADHDVMIRSFVVHQGGRKDQRSRTDDGRAFPGRMDG